uniref:hypothetical protein n=1 Tax=Acetobacter pasteurianus TaxID=438 RepID=UPI0014450605|nr:hypothetical protein [Acetobacter pasteurianus]
MLGENLSGQDATDCFFLLLLQFIKDAGGIQWKGSGVASGRMGLTIFKNRLIRRRSDGVALRLYHFITSIR